MLRVESDSLVRRTSETALVREAVSSDTALLAVAADSVLSLPEGAALGFSTTCKISTTTETGERVTKEASAGKWKEKFVKSFSETITAEGCVLTDGDDQTPTYDQLKAKQLAGEPIEASYNLREGTTREGKTTGGYKGSFIITQLELDGPAGDDAKYSVTLENSGPVTAVEGGSGLSPAAAG